MADTENDSSSRPTLLILVRHAVIADTGKVLSGRTPGLDLSEEGRAQAKAVGERLMAFPLTGVYSSPIERTTQTAEAIAESHGLEVRPLEGVIEGDYGEWCARPLTELAEHDLWKVVQRTPSRMRFPGGESIPEMQARVVHALDAVVARHPGESVVVVSHFDPIKTAVAHYLGLALDLYQRLVIGPASATIFAFPPPVSGGTAPVLLTLNNTDALDPFVPAPPVRTGDEASGDGGVP